MRAYTRAVLTITHAEFVFMFLVSLAFFIGFQLNYSVKCRLEGLSILSESSLKVNSVLGFSKRSQHEFWGSTAECSARWVSITHHCVLVDPKY